MSATPVKTHNRHDKRKKQTRSALRAAALELFATKGYDITTTEEIAERAGVSARTFFRYFPTKDTVLFLSRRDWVGSVASDFLGRPPSMSDAEALTASFLEVGSGLAPLRETLDLYERAVASSPTLRGCEQDRKREDTEVLAGAIATRRGLEEPDQDCILLAEIGLLTHRLALDRWLDGRSVDGLEATIAEEFRRLIRLVTPS